MRRTRFIALNAVFALQLPPDIVVSSDVVGQPLSLAATVEITAKWSTARAYVARMRKELLQYVISAVVGTVAIGDAGDGGVITVTEDAPLRGVDLSSATVRRHW